MQIATLLVGKQKLVVKMIVDLTAVFSLKIGVVSVFFHISFMYGKGGKV
jgi:hypothetical protein